MKRIISRPTIPMLCLAVLASAANAADKKPATTAPQDASAMAANAEKGPIFGRWQLLCSNKSALDPADRCRIAQTVLSDQTRVRLLMVRVYRGTPNIAMISTPHSISLKPGLVVKIDDKESRAFSFETCNEDGCHVGIPLTEELESEFRGGSNAVFHFFDGGQRRVAAPVSLEGFKDAEAEMGRK